MHRLDLDLYSHSKEFWGNGVRIHVNSRGKKNPLYQRLRGGSNLRRCITLDSEPNTPPIVYFHFDSVVSCEKLSSIGIILLIDKSLHFMPALLKIFHK